KCFSRASVMKYSSFSIISLHAFSSPSWWNSDPPASRPASIRSQLFEFLCFTSRSATLWGDPIPALRRLRGLKMLSWFRKLLPREDRFVDLFESHADAVVGGAKALQQLLGGGPEVERWCNEIVDLENAADRITGEVMLAVRRSFITPFDRGDIQDLIQSMDDAIDTMHKTVKTVRLFEKTEFYPLMQE